MSDDLDSMLATYGRESEDEKQEHFEASTVKLIAKQLGVKCEEGSDCTWLDEQGYIPATVICRRVFTFRFEDLLFKPSKHDIVKEYKLVADGITDDIIWVFKVYGYGRVVCTTLPPVDQPAFVSLTNPLDPASRIYILPFTDYFRNFNEDVR